MPNRTTSQPDIDAIKTDVEAFSLPNGRRVGQPGHDVARDYVVRRLQELDLPGFAGVHLVLPYSASDPETGSTIEFAN